MHMCLVGGVEKVIKMWTLGYIYIFKIRISLGVINKHTTGSVSKEAYLTSFFIIHPEISLGCESACGKLIGAC